MRLKIIQTELPKIIYNNCIHILKCVENNTPIKRAIRREIYKWIINEINEYKNNNSTVYLCNIIRNIFYVIAPINCLDYYADFNLNKQTQNVFPELNINKIRYYTKKNKIKLNIIATDSAWFNGNNYDARINILIHCINTIDRNIKREKRVASSTGGQH